MYSITHSKQHSASVAICGVREKKAYGSRVKLKGLWCYKRKQVLQHGCIILTDCIWLSSAASSSSITSTSPSGSWLVDGRASVCRRTNVLKVVWTIRDILEITAKIFWEKRLLFTVIQLHVGLLAYQHFGFFSSQLYFANVFHQGVALGSLESSWRTNQWVVSHVVMQYTQC